MARTLINHEKIEINKKDNRGNTPLHMAVYHGRDKIVQLLLNAGADPLIKNLDGKTALDIAFDPKNISATLTVRPILRKHMKTH